ncbi:DUF1648 domain-containing protein [Deinococcus peraridilitoris]|uniref:DUF1648 domain-containing protein n=1 Tax=Deinococcus peraridilitoris (strain DSM 19664 / LMG 22246 / CIP 109416 / KR-200) TaxID=937777 RepID=L0A1L7_DEIPD|nr:DUF1648 domain-containing protein [Deinococcus peraridilitoris]AFZ67344.1 Protein of unknown function (DUF1648) [Deinococcus peraridilitoris DSM 19664]
MIRRNDLRKEWPTLLAFAVTFAASAYLWPRSPEVIPVHWGLNGEPDRFGSRAEGLLLLPGLLLGNALLMLAVERFSAHGARNATVLRTVRLVMGVTAALLTLRMVFDWEVPRTVIIAVGIIFALLGNVLGKAHPGGRFERVDTWTPERKRAWYATTKRSSVQLTFFGSALLFAGLLLPDVWLTPWVAPFGLLGGLLIMMIRLGLDMSSWRSGKNSTTGSHGPR